ncbi:MAG: GUN4 domain-containing protein [Oscillatoriophycideae cyanobacterium NC_groundwater_1537_Pr4_S-0.65um_50_18]|nr:GUN4 domain-containing protein [Oscillatoriophycideae cyanobacterium NC_groundwater_1537_Pr4_S-0.65um_50_18]
MSDTIEVFISYSKQDKELRDGLLAHLRPLETKGIISWHDRQILPGTRWDEEIKARLNAADIILLLISADFLNTDYCNQVEIPEALRRHEAGEATVMPVILRSCGWKYTPLAAIQAYPEKAKPIVSWTHIDDAYTDVVDGVYLAATEITKGRTQKTQQAEQLRQQQAAEAERKQQELANQQRQSIDTDDLRSDRNTNYKPLRDLLKAGKWKEADQETAKKMCEVMGRQEEGWLRVEDIEQFPCTDLRTIDQLWVKYSQGQFGFSVQKKIYLDCGGKPDGKYSGDKIWNEFGDRVGWRVKGEWIYYSDLTFDTSAKKGHLPIWTPRLQKSRLGLVGWVVMREWVGLWSSLSLLSRTDL